MTTKEINQIENISNNITVIYFDSKNIYNTEEPLLKFHIIDNEGKLMSAFEIIHVIIPNTKYYKKAKYAFQSSDKELIIIGNLLVTNSSFKQLKKRYKKDKLYINIINNIEKTLNIKTTKDFQKIYASPNNNEYSIYDFFKK